MMAFFESKLFLAINSKKNYFECSLFKKVNEFMIEKFNNEVSEILIFIDELFQLENQTEAEVN